MAAQNEILIKFEVDGLQFEAVGALRDGEPRCLIEEALRRTAGENGGAIKGKDEAFLRARLAQLPSELDPYWLVTDERHPARPRDVSCFERDYHRWDWLGYSFTSHYLIVRRCS